MAACASSLERTAQARSARGVSRLHRGRFRVHLFPSHTGRRSIPCRGGAPGGESGTKARRCRPDAPPTPERGVHARPGAHGPAHRGEGTNAHKESKRRAGGGGRGGLAVCFLVSQSVIHSVSRSVGHHEPLGAEGPGASAGGGGGGGVHGLAVRLRPQEGLEAQLGLANLSPPPRGRAPEPSWGGGSSRRNAA